MLTYIVTLFAGYFLVQGTFKNKTKKKLKIVISGTIVDKYISKANFTTGIRSQPRVIHVLDYIIRS